MSVSLTPRRSLLGQLWHGDDRRRVGASVLALARPSATTTGRERVDRQHASALRAYLRLPWSFEQVVIFAAALVVLTGCVFRFTALERKVYWHDETITSIRIAGYPYGPFVDTIPGGKRFSVHYLQRYQQVSGRGVLDTARSLADGDPQHPPLYYELARLWGKSIGDSVGSLRALSAAISVMALAAMFLFCRVLFESRLAGWLGVAVLAASPFQLFYAQEAREYALWSLLTLLSCVALLYALREPAKKRGWLIYCLSLVLSLYVFVLTLFVIAAHAVMVVATARSRLRQVAVPFSACVGVAVLAFTPWLLVMYRHRAAISATNGWTRETIPRVDLLRSWLSTIGLDFFANPWTGTAATLASLPFLALSLYAGYVLIRTARRRVSLTVGALFVATAVPLMLADFVLGGQRSVTARYMAPALLAIQLAVVYLLVTKLRTKQLRSRVLWSGVALLIVVAGLASWANSIGAEHGR